jgi:Tol biopolymer transport system component
VNRDGTRNRQLTSGSFRDFGPRWSPDGKLIAFCSTRSGKFEIWSVRSDGSDLKQLSRHPGAHYPVWDPAGTRISYSYHSPNGNSIFYPFNDKIKEIALPPLPNQTDTFEAWTWSPDGQMLAGIHHLTSGDHVGIILYSFQTQQFQWLTNFGENPVWSKDGRSVIFSNKGKLFSITIPDKQLVQIPSPLMIAGAFTLSPDQKTIYTPIDTTLADIWLIQLKPAS